jgi:hypothetical protein
LRLSVGGSTHDIRMETRKVLELDEVLWTATDADVMPPERLPFEFRWPDALEDGKPFPPSFDAGRRRRFPSGCMPVGTSLGS